LTGRTLAQYIYPELNFNMGHITAITDLDKAIGKCMAFMCESLITLAANEPMLFVYSNSRLKDRVFGCTKK